MRLYLLGEKLDRSAPYKVLCTTEILATSYLQTLYFCEEARFPTKEGGLNFQCIRTYNMFSIYYYHM